MFTCLIIITKASKDWLDDAVTQQMHIKGYDKIQNNIFKSALKEAVRPWSHNKSQHPHVSQCACSFVVDSWSWVICKNWHTTVDMVYMNSLSFLGRGGAQGSNIKQSCTSPNARSRGLFQQRLIWRLLNDCTHVCFLFVSLTVMNGWFWPGFCGSHHFPVCISTLYLLEWSFQSGFYHFMRKCMHWSYARLLHRAEMGHSSCWLLSRACFVLCQIWRAERKTPE